MDREGARKVPVDVEKQTEERSGIDIGPSAERGEPDVVASTPRRPHLQAVEQMKHGPPPTTEPTVGTMERPISTTPEPLIDPNRIASLRSRWNEIQASFIDDPRTAVTKADELVEEMLSVISDSFANQRRTMRGVLERRGEGEGGSSTEEMRQALHHYRAFFVRVLAV